MQTVLEKKQKTKTQIKDIKAKVNSSENQIGMLQEKLKEKETDGEKSTESLAQQLHLQ